ncbi:MAG: hypothetical protein QF363_05130 [Planctomycetaceae bacterium]|jgi:hypothetical protein|nr:hypothetical protein [Planctomycetaceae bacterium]
MMESSNNTNGPDGGTTDAGWLAFAYVAGELDAESLAAWESRLSAGDVEACEAVVAAVELVQVISAARPAVAMTTGSDTPPRRRGLGALLAASVCLVLAIGLLWGGAATDGRRLVEDEESVRQADTLMAVWTEGGERSPVETSEVVTADEGEPLVVPEWLIAAVSLSDDAMEDGK